MSIKVVQRTENAVHYYKPYGANIFYLIINIPRVEAGKNTSTVIPCES
jgi:hypothetical protein